MYVAWTSAIDTVQRSRSQPLPADWLVGLGDWQPDRSRRPLDATTWNIGACTLQVEPARSATPVGLRRS
jgi:hypothetical protein